MIRAAQGVARKAGSRSFGAAGFSIPELVSFMAVVGSLSQLWSHRLSARASGTVRRNAEPHVMDCSGLARTLVWTLGKRVRGNPSGVRISYPPPR